ncbi:MAG: phospholipase [Desulfuromonadaceae bacterium]|nr:phospholipase [Desulfuromonadaceae bacterium]MDD5105417.1 phospholipase [Desulfuromonadaceae bacterium]
MPVVKTLIVFVHGWSVTNTDTYGGLPLRLRAEAASLGLDIRIEEIFLGRYISFHDEVRVSDISRAFRTAVADELSALLQDGTRFVCITHSTGGPVIRDWWQRYYASNPQAGICPMSHLVMLAPANFGSALAQLGKSRISRLKSWFEGVEPGQGVLDWLELGSKEACTLNMEWLCSDGSQIGPTGIFPFVLTGQSIDRSIYDNLNAYTGETGSDGVVRVAAANLSGTYIKLLQEVPQAIPGKPGAFSARELKVETICQAPKTALRVISGKSHSGEKMGIMRSVKVTQNDVNSMETINAILACMQVASGDQYDALCDRFRAETDAVQKAEQVEIEQRLFRSDVRFIHDRYSMVIFRVQDDEGHPVADYDLLLTAGPDSDPNHLPQGFFIDRQRNAINPDTITYYLNRDVMKGTGEITGSDKNPIRTAQAGSEMLGFRIIARPDNGFVHYLPCEFKASPDMLQTALHANSTTLVDIVLRRIVRKNVFLVGKVTSGTKAVNFAKTKPGDEIVG